MEHEGSRPPEDDPSPMVNAGEYPPALLEVCQLWGVAPGALLGWSVRNDGVSIVLPNGQKVGAALRGEWAIPAGKAKIKAKK